MAAFLITGGAGFIGAALSRRLLANGHEVVIIDNLSTGFIENIPKEAIFIQGNCEDESTIARLNKQPFQTIFHIAGQSSGEVSFDDPVLDLQANVQSTIMLLKYALTINCNRFIYASSMSVYGDKAVLPVNEMAETKPKSFYAVGKLASEHYLRIYEAFGMNNTALRLFNVYGEGQNMLNLRQGMASIFLAQALQGNTIEVKGTLDRFRDFIHVEDVVDAFIKAAEMDIPSGVYNVCRGEAISVKNILDNITSTLNKPLSIRELVGTPGDQHGIYGDPSLLHQCTGWESKISFQEGFSRMISWAKVKYYENT